MQWPFSPTERSLLQVEQTIIIQTKTSGYGGTTAMDLPTVVLEQMALQLMTVEVAMNRPNYMQGKSLLPLLTGQADLGRHKDHVISEFHDSLKLPNHSHGTMYFDGRYKLAVYEGQAIGELYDLESDPGEFVNLWDDPASSSLKLELMHRHFQAYLATNSPGIHRSKETWPGAGHAAKSPSIYD